MSWFVVWPDGAEDAAQFVLAKTAQSAAENVMQNGLWRTHGPSIRLCVSRCSEAGQDPAAVPHDDDVHVFCLTAKTGWKHGSFFLDVCPRRV